jgi:hypothetical protein
MIILYSFVFKLVLLTNEDILLSKLRKATQNFFQCSKCLIAIHVAGANNIFVEQKGLSF